MPHSKLLCFGHMDSIQRYGTRLPGAPAIKQLRSGLRPALPNGASGALELTQRIEAVQSAVLLLHVIKSIRKADQ